MQLDQDSGPGHAMPSKERDGAIAGIKEKYKVAFESVNGLLDRYNLEARRLIADEFDLSGPADKDVKFDFIQGCSTIAKAGHVNRLPSGVEQIWYQLDDMSWNKHHPR